MIENSRLRAFIQGHILGEFDLLPQSEVAKRLGVLPVTISRWKRKVDWEHIKTERRKRYGVHICEIDAALLKQAKKGEARSVELAYQRFEGWIPTEARVTITEAQNDQLKQRAEQIKAEFIAQNEAIGQGAGQHLPGAGEARA